jgi:hypothetical protein
MGTGWLGGLAGLLCWLGFCSAGCLSWLACFAVVRLVPLPGWLPRRALLAGWFCWLAWLVPFPSWLPCRALLACSVGLLAWLAGLTGWVVAGCLCCCAGWRALVAHLADSISWLLVKANPLYHVSLCLKTLVRAVLVNVHAPVPKACSARSSFG